MAGWARHSPNLVQKVSTLLKPLDVSLEGLAEHNLKVLASVRSSGDSDADLLAWAKCQKEFESGGILGPGNSLGEIPFKDFRLLIRFVIHEQHGGQDPTVRCIDECLMGMQNECAATTAAHRPCDLDTWVAFCRVVASKFEEALSAITSDFKSDCLTCFSACPGFPEVQIHMHFPLTFNRLKCNLVVPSVHMLHEGIREQMSVHGMHAKSVMCACCCKFAR